MHTHANTHMSSEYSLPESRLPNGLAIRIPYDTSVWPRPVRYHCDPNPASYLRWLCVPLLQDQGTLWLDYVR